MWPEWLSGSRSAPASSSTSADREPRRTSALLALMTRRAPALGAIRRAAENQWATANLGDHTLIERGAGDMAWAQVSGGRTTPAIQHPARYRKPSSKRDRKPCTGGAPSGS